MGTAMRAKKLVILLAVLLVVGLGLFGWFRPREVVLPENCRLRVTIDSFSDDRIFVEDPEKKAQLLELLSALRVRRYFKQPESDFPPGLTLRVGEYARVEVFDPSNGIVAYYTVSLIQPPLGTFTNLSTQTRWRLQDNEAVAAVAAYIRQLTEYTQKKNPAPAMQGPGFSCFRPAARRLRLPGRARAAERPVGA